MRAENFEASKTFTQKIERGIGHERPNSFLYKNSASLKTDRVTSQQLMEKEKQIKEALRLKNAKDVFSHFQQYSEMLSRWNGQKLEEHQKTLDRTAPKQFPLKPGGESSLLKRAFDSTRKSSDSQSLPVEPSETTSSDYNDKGTDHGKDKHNKIHKKDTILDRKGRKVNLDKLFKIVKEDKSAEGLLNGTITTRDMAAKEHKMLSISYTVEKKPQIGGKVRSIEKESPHRGDPGYPSESEGRSSDTRSEAKKSSRSGDFTGYQKRPIIDQISNRQYDTQTRQFRSLIPKIEQKLTNSYIVRLTTLGQNYRNEKHRIIEEQDAFHEQSPSLPAREKYDKIIQDKSDNLYENYRMAVANVENNRKMQQQMMAIVRRLLRLTPRG